MNSSVSTAASNGEIYLVSILVSSMAHWFNLSVPADVHWIGMNSIREYHFASDGENLYRGILVSSVAYWFNLSVPTDVHWIGMNSIREYRCF